MATQAGLATSKVVILVLGAGVTTQIVLGKATLSDVIATVQETLFKGEKNERGGQSSDNEAIQAQIMRLAQEVKQLYGGRQITVVNASERNSSVSSYIVPIAVLGVAGYGYMWWKGWSFSDVMYVTRKSMSNYVSNFSKQLEQVTSAITAAKKHLVQRMEKITGKLDEQKETTGAIRLEVGEARESLAQMGLDIDTVQRLVEGLECQVDRVEGNQDHINAGVVYLCQFVQGLSGGQRPELVQFTPAKGRLEQSPSSAGGLGGLKELQYFKDALKTEGAPTDGDQTASTVTEVTPGRVATYTTVLSRGRIAP